MTAKGKHRRLGSGVGSLAITRPSKVKVKANCFSSLVSSTFLGDKLRRVSHKRQRFRRGGFSGQLVGYPVFVRRCQWGAGGKVPLRQKTRRSVRSPLIPQAKKKKLDTERQKTLGGEGERKTIMSGTNDTNEIAICAKKGILRRPVSGSKRNPAQGGHS